MKFVAVSAKTGCFLCVGDSQTGIHKRSVYEHNGVAVCSQKRALCIATVVLSILFVVSLIIAYAGPQSGKMNGVMVFL